MKKQMTVYLYRRRCEFEPDGWRLTFHSAPDMDGYNNEWFLLGSSDVEFEYEDFDGRQKLAEAMRAEKAAIIREATAKAEALEEKIQQLLALPQGEAA